jgi:hypothetical protein
MNPQDYTNPSSNSDQSTEVWFNQLDPPNLPPIQTPSPKSKKKPLILGGIGLACAALIIASGIILAPILLSSPCLTAADYKALTGSPLEDELSARENFYTYAVDFMAGSANYSKETKTESEQLIKKVGTFSKEHSKSSLVITLSSDYIDSSSKTVAEQRIAKLKQALLDNGVAETAIKIVTPQKIIPEEGTPIKDTPAYISIASDETCRES